MSDFKGLSGWDGSFTYLNTLYIHATEDNANQYLNKSVC